MSDVIERILNRIHDSNMDIEILLDDCKIEIESLRQRVAELEVVIKDFAQIERGMEEELAGYIKEDEIKANVNKMLVEELAALKQSQGEPYGFLDPDTMEVNRTLHEHRKCATVWAVFLHTTPTIPEGWKIVPINPTNEMILAAVKGQSNRTTVPSDDELAAGMYYDMLAAAPKHEDL